MRRNTLITSWNEVPVLFDVPFACRLCGLNPNAVRALCASGKLPARKIGGNWRIEKGEFLKWMGIGGDRD